MTARIGAREIDTPLGTFYGGIFETKTEHGPTFYAETESGDVTINGVTYRGAVYARRYRDDGQLWLDAQHLTRWDGRHFQPASDSARRKLAPALLPIFEEWAKDAAYVTERRISSLRSSHGYAVSAINREIDKANALAAEMRELGADCPDIPRVELADSLA